MRIWTLAQAKEKIQTDMDLQEETFVTTAELTEYFNEAIDEAEALIHNLYEDYFRRKITLALVGGTKEYDLPEDIYANKIRLIFFNDGTVRYKVWRIDPRKIGLVDEGNARQEFRYDLENTDAATGTQIVFYPTPAQSFPTQVTMWYIRNANRVAVDADLIDIPEFMSFIFAFVKVKVGEKELSPLLGNYRGEMEKQATLMRQTLATMIPDEDDMLEMDFSFYEDFDGYGHYE